MVNDHSLVYKLTDIRHLDSLQDDVWERFFIRQCGLVHEFGSSDLDATPKYHHLSNREILTREILESNLDEIIDKIILFKDFISNPVLRPRNPKYDGYWVISEDDIYIGFQILGVLILQTGSYLPKIVEDSILYSTRWDYDKERGWSKSCEKERKENLESFRHAILSHKEGKITVL